VGYPKEERTARNHYAISMTSSCNQDVQVGSPKEEQRAARRPSLELAISRDPEHLRDSCARGHVHAISMPSACHQQSTAIRGNPRSIAPTRSLRTWAPFISNQRSSAAVNVHQLQSASISRTQSHSVALSRTQSQSPAQVGGMPIVRSNWIVGPSERRSAPPGPAPPCQASPGAGGPYVARGSYTLPMRGS
jgi:hypothetical protein